MIIETERLKLIALKYEELYLLINDIEKLENILTIKYDATPIEGSFKDILLSQLEITKNDKDNYMWHSFWLIIRKSDNIAIGMIDFKDTPNENGEVEIGYGLGEKFEHNGYMTESVKALCSWALKEDSVKSVIAETDKDGFSSQKILKNCGFNKYKDADTSWWVRYGESI